MRTKSLKKNKINVVTLGCSKNVYDSEVLMGQLKANGKEVVHALENLGDIPLELIEVQVGSYLGEDDIVRYEDHYGRVETK